MPLSIVKVNELPLGKRVLRFGSYGRDVVALQKLLNQAGFYFGEADGWYGILTGEAVTLLQKAFHLKVDGVTGPEVLNILLKKGLKSDHIIYRIRKEDDMEIISSRFGVKKSAWKRIPGQSDPHKKIYPGLKMLLYEKVFLTWNEPCQLEISFPVTGSIQTDYQISMDGKSLCVAQLKNEGTSLDFLLYHGIGASREVWEKLLSSPKLWKELALQLEKLKHLKFGFDFREVPMKRFPCLAEFSQILCRRLQLSRLEFQIVPLLPRKGKFESHLFWINLPVISSHFQYILVEPCYDVTSPDLFRESVASLLKDTAQFIKIGLAEKTILICQISGWNWNRDQNHFEKVPYKVAKLLRAQYTSKTQYFSDTKLWSVDYVKHHERQCLIYRDERSWRELLNHAPILNLAGIAMVNFRDLGKAGPEMISSSFKIRSLG